MRVGLKGLENMNTERFEKTTGTSAVRQIPILQETLRKIDSSYLAQIELSLINQKLVKLQDFKRGPDGNNYIESLIKRRAELIQQTHFEPVAGNELHSQSLDGLITNIGPYFGPWTTVNLPYMDEGINQTPGEPGTQNSIGTVGLYAGGLAYGGMPKNDTDKEYFWIHNWTCSFVFPPAPFPGKLYYRFTVDSHCEIYNAPVQNGVVAEFITIGKTADINSSSPFADGNVASSGFPFFQELQLPIFYSDTSTPISGSISVDEGKNAALAFIYGASAGFASGYIQYSYGTFGTRLTLPPGTNYDGEVFDKIQYRFEPTWFVEAVNQRFQMDRA